MKAPIIPQVKQGTNQSNIFNRTGLGFFKQPNGNNLGFSTKRTVYCADLFMTAVINNPARQEVPCRQIMPYQWGGHHPKPAGNRLQGTAVPQSGNQHGQRIGMASSPLHPLNTPLMAQPNFFYGYLNSDIGKRKGRTISMKNGQILKKKKY